MEKVISKDGTSIAFDRYGEGQVVILVGGAFQHRAIDPATARLAQLLARQFTVLHYDRRGRGDSTNTLPYAVEREVEDLQALIDAGGEPAFVFGMSSGAALALEAAACGLPIQKLALYEPPFNTTQEQGQETVDYNQQLNALLAEGRRDDAAAFAMMSFGAPEEAVAGMRQSPIWQRFASAAPTLAYDSAVLGDGFVNRLRMAAIKVPALVIVGGETFDFMHEAASVLVDALPNAQHHLLKGQSHNVDPEALAPVLLDFFARS